MDQFFIADTPLFSTPGGRRFPATPLVLDGVLDGTATSEIHALARMPFSVNRNLLGFNFQPVSKPGYRHRAARSPDHENRSFRRLASGRIQ